MQSRNTSFPGSFSERGVSGTSTKRDFLPRPSPREIWNHCCVGISLVTSIMTRRSSETACCQDEEAISQHSHRKFCVTLECILAFHCGCQQSHQVRLYRKMFLEAPDPLIYLVGRCRLKNQHGMTSAGGMCQKEGLAIAVSLIAHGVKMLPLTLISAKSVLLSSGQSSNFSKMFTNTTSFSTD